MVKMKKMTRQVSFARPVRDGEPAFKVNVGKVNGIPLVR